MAPEHDLGGSWICSRLPPGRSCCLAQIHGLSSLITTCMVLHFTPCTCYALS